MILAIGVVLTKSGRDEGLQLPRDFHTRWKLEPRKIFLLVCGIVGTAVLYQGEGAKVRESVRHKLRRSS
jgi:hypothetical protein